MDERDICRNIIIICRQRKVKLSIKWKKLYDDYRQPFVGVLQNRCFLKLKVLQKITIPGLFCNKVAGYKTLTMVFYCGLCELCGMFENTFIEHLLVTDNAKDDKTVTQLNSPYSNYGEVWIIGSCDKFRIFTIKHGFWISLLRRVYLVQELENNSIITYRQITFSIYLSISFLEKIFNIRPFSRFLFFPIDDLMDFSDRLNNPFAKFE